MTDAAGPADASSADALAWRCARAMLAADEASRALDMRLIDAGAGRATVRMGVTSQMLNGHRIGHGGYTFMLADSAFAFACNSHDIVNVAASCEIVFVAPTRAGDVLEATAVERSRAGRRGVYDVTVARVDDVSGSREVVAEFRGVSHASREQLLASTPPGAEPDDEERRR